jgi:hypothetical protein
MKRPIANAVGVLIAFATCTAHADTVTDVPARSTRRGPGVSRATGLTLAAARS